MKTQEHIINRATKKTTNWGTRPPKQKRRKNGNENGHQKRDTKHDASISPDDISSVFFTVTKEEVRYILSLLPENFYEIDHEIKWFELDENKQKIERKINV